MATYQEPHMNDPRSIDELRRRSRQPTRAAALTAASVAAFIGLTGCAGSDSDLHGQWIGTCSPSPQASMLPVPTSLEFTGEGNFSLSWDASKRRTTTSGTYSTQDDQLLLDFTEPAKWRGAHGTGRYALTDTNTLTVSGLRTGTAAMWCTLTRR